MYKYVGSLLTVISFIDSTKRVVLWDFINLKQQVHALNWKKIQKNYVM